MAGGRPLWNQECLRRCRTEGGPPTAACCGSGNLTIPDGAVRPPGAAAQVPHLVQAQRHQSSVGVLLLLGRRCQLHAGLREQPEGGG